MYLMIEVEDLLIFLFVYVS